MVVQISEDFEEEFKRSIRVRKAQSRAYSDKRLRWKLCSTRLNMS